MSIPFADHIRVSTEAGKIGTSDLACRGCGVPVSHFASNLGWSHTVQDCLQRLREENEAMRERLQRIEDRVFYVRAFGPGGGR